MYDRGWVEWRFLFFLGVLRSFPPEFYASSHKTLRTIWIRKKMALLGDQS